MESTSEPLALKFYFGCCFFVKPVYPVGEGFKTSRSHCGGTVQSVYTSSSYLGKRLDLIVKIRLGVGPAS